MLARGPVRTIASLWMTATAVIAGVDTYQGMRCDGWTGDYTDGIWRDRAAYNAFNIAAAVPAGALRGILYNFQSGIGGGGQCAARGYGRSFGEQLAHRMGPDLGPGVRVVYGLNQAIVGIPGAIAGGILAEEVWAFRQAGLQP